MEKSEITYRVLGPNGEAESTGYPLEGHAAAEERALLVKGCVIQITRTESFRLLADFREPLDKDLEQNLATRIVRFFFPQ